MQSKNRESLLNGNLILSRTRVCPCNYTNINIRLTLLDFPSNVQNSSKVLALTGSDHFEKTSEIFCLANCCFGHELNEFIATKKLLISSFVVAELLKNLFCICSEIHEQKHLR